MNKNKVLIGTFIGLISIFGIAISSILSTSHFSNGSAISGDYELNVRNITNEELISGEANINTSLNNPIRFVFSSESTYVDSGVICLSTNGYFKNDTPISGIKKISGNVSSAASLNYGNNSYLNYGSSNILGDFNVDLDYSSNYFGISTDEGTVINSLKVTYSCVPSPDKPSGDYTMTYEFKGDEETIKGYAEGTVTLKNKKGFKENEVYDFYWGTNLGKLDNTYPLHSEIITSSMSEFKFDIEENVSIPNGVSALTVYKDNELVTFYSLEEEKLFNDEVTYKFASISDVHCNYQQGEKHFLELLNAFEEENVEYIIFSGDIGETNEHFTRYKNACLNSSYTGLILSCPGNHDQKTQDALDLYNSVAIYDGGANTFVQISDGPSYFSSEYEGTLPIQVFYEDIEGSNNTYYYYATIGDNMFYFMDLKCLNADGDERYSKKQLDHLETILYKYSNAKDLTYDEYNLFIVEHAPLDQFKVGDKFKPGYGGQVKVAPYLDNNYRLGKLLEEYHEAFFINGHTHVQFEQLEEQYKCINFTDRYYDLYGNLTDKPFARVIHNSSVAMPRWFYLKSNGSLTMSSQDNHSSGSEAYIVKQYSDRTVFEALSNKEYTPESTDYDPSLYGIKYYSKYAYSCPKMFIKHSTIKDFANVSSIVAFSGSPSISEDGDKINLSLSSGDSIKVKLDNLDLAYDQNESLRLILSSEVKVFVLSGIDDEGNVSKTVNIDLSNGCEKYSYGLRDNKYTLQVDIKDLFASKVNGYNLSLSDYKGMMELYSVRVMKHDDVTARGKHAFTRNIDTSVMFEDTTYTSIQFDYRLESGSHFEMCVMTEDWQDYYGYWQFNKYGISTSSTGVTTEVLDDGYVRVNIDFSTCKKKTNPSSLARFYVRGDHTEGCGYIDNIILTKGEITPIDTEYRGETFYKGTDKTISMTSLAGATHISFEYCLVTSGYFNMMVFNNTDWHHYNGYFKFDKNGAASSYAGVTTEKLADGYIKVSLALSKLDRTGSQGAPLLAVDSLYIRGGDFSTADGYIDNVRLEVNIEPRGEAFNAGTDLHITTTRGNYTHVSFEYRFVSGIPELAVSLLDDNDWSLYYGYFIFDDEGASYSGITCSLLPDGYIKVDIDIASLNRTNNETGNLSKAPTTLERIYVRGGWTKGNGYIDNVIFS